MNLKCYTTTISELVKKYEKGVLNLEPTYQRKSVWGYKQRVQLLNSIFNGIVIPSIIIRTRKVGKKKISDVLDGKQRIETLLFFIKKKGFSDQKKELIIKLFNQETNKSETVKFEDITNKPKDLSTKKFSQRFWNYKISVVEYDDEIKDFYGKETSDLEVFVRINSTGTRLSSGEIKHAAKFSLKFFELGLELEKKYKNYFLKKWKVTNDVAINRYQFNEFILVLCTSVKSGGNSDRKRELDSLLELNLSEKEIRNIKSKFNKTINWIKQIFPGETIKPTRFKNKSDFYSLFVTLLTLLNDNYITNDNRSNKLAREFLIKFSEQLNLFSKKHGSGRLSKPESKLSQYIIAGRQATDSLTNRKIRSGYILSLLSKGTFIKKDKLRIFQRNDKDLLWLIKYSNKKSPKCPHNKINPNCKVHLRYDDAQVDHKWAWSKGGPTTLNNAQLLCSKCNKIKSNK